MPSARAFFLDLQSGGGFALRGGDGLDFPCVLFTDVLNRRDFRTQLAGFGGQTVGGGFGSRPNIAAAGFGFTCQSLPPCGGFVGKGFHPCGSFCGRFFARFGKGGVFTGFDFAVQQVFQTLRQTALGNLLLNQLHQRRGVRVGRAAHGGGKFPRIARRIAHAQPKPKFVRRADARQRVSVLRVGQFGQFLRFGQIGGSAVADFHRQLVGHRLRPCPHKVYRQRFAHGTHGADFVVQRPRSNQRLGIDAACVAAAYFGAVAAFGQAVQHDFRRRRIGNMAVKFAVAVDFDVVGQHLSVRRQIVPCQRHLAAARVQRRIRQQRLGSAQAVHFTRKIGRSIHRRVFGRVVQQGGDGVSAFVRVLFDADTAVQARLDPARQNPHVSRRYGRSGVQNQRIGRRLRRHFRRHDAVRRG